MRKERQYVAGMKIRSRVSELNAVVTWDSARFSRREDVPTRKTENGERRGLLYMLILLFAVDPKHGVEL